MLSPRPELWPALKSGLNVMWKSEPNISKQVLSTIRTPVAIVDGEKDEIIKLEHTKEIADSIPKAKLSILPGTSHFAMLQDPAQFNADLTSFLVEQT
jgi:pimeloyl-ACP methyl ester carboxylesterase